jgi:serine/threonine protein kinase
VASSRRRNSTSVQAISVRADARLCLITLAELLVEKESTKRQKSGTAFAETSLRLSRQVGSSIPGYRIIRKLGGQARMATVFLAKQLSLDRLVAIKVRPKKFSQNQNFIERFLREGRAAAKLSHNNIVAAYEIGQAGEHHFFVMEYAHRRHGLRPHRRAETPP